MKWHESLRSAPVAGASNDEVQSFSKKVFAPLTDAEIRDLINEHRSVVGEGCFDPPFRPAEWKLPSRRLPDSYLDFVRLSNGGYFQGRHRDLDPLFSINEVRDYLLGYSVPHWMPEACPIGFDGGGGFYLLDMRSEADGDDYPIVWAHASNLSFDDAKVLAPSFHEFVRTALGGK
jgi:hypothetical protein